MKKINKLIVFALAAQGTGLSGGDRIFIELTRRWADKFPIDIFLWQQGKAMCESQRLGGKNISFRVSNIPKWSDKFALVNYLIRVFEAIRLGFTLKLDGNTGTFLYNASEFWMDSFPCAILKFRYPKIRWIATWYQTAPNPLKGYVEKGRKSSEGRKSNYNLSALLYWLAQLPVKPLINLLADKVIVNNEDERKRFLKHTSRGNTIVMIGAVPLADIKKFLATNYKLLSAKKYDAVFQGRFHPQKGVMEMIDIWRLVVNARPDAKLGMIGDGPLMSAVKLQISKYKLQNNIKLFGYVFDGDEKYKLFASGKVVVHPAFYDSGGMASAEAMAFGLPCVGFDLKAYESYYPKGMVKVPVGHKQSFANAVIKLLKNKKYYKKISNEALSMIEANWSWETRSEQILLKINN